MSVNERSRIHWRDIEAALPRYDAAVLHDRVHAWIDEFMPRNVPRRKGRSELRDMAVYQRRIDLVIGRELAPWYGFRGWRIGNESFGGCFCHSFLTEYAVEPHREAVNRATAWVLAEVDVMARCLRNFGQVYGQFGLPDDPGDRAIAFASTLDQLFDVVSEATACNAAWHRYLVDGIGWLLDARGIETPPVLESLIDASVSAVCCDFLHAPRDDRYRLCNDLSTVFVLASR